MNLLFIQQALPEPIRAIRDQFRQGGSFAELLLALLALGALLGLAYMATEVQRRKRVGVSRRSTPQQLFEHLLQNLRLTASEQEFLLTACREAKLAHPASLLIAEKLFVDVITKMPQPQLTADQIADLRGRLFPPLARSGVLSAPARQLSGATPINKPN